MVKFNLIEGCDDEYKEIYENFKKDFLDIEFNIDDLMLKYDLSFNKYNQLRKKVCNELGIKSKPRANIKHSKIITDYTYIHKYGKKYGVFKTINNHRESFGFYDNLVTAQRIRNKLIEVDWDKKYLNKIIEEVG